MPVLNEWIEDILKLFIALLWTSTHENVRIDFFDSRIDAVDEINIIIGLFSLVGFPYIFFQVLLESFDHKLSWLIDEKMLIVTQLSFIVYKSFVVNHILLVNKQIDAQVQFMTGLSVWSTDFFDWVNWDLIRIKSLSKLRSIIFDI